VVTRKVLPNFLARGEEQPLERQFDLNFELSFNAGNNSILEPPPS
jgi:hypothetical protein